MLQFRQTIYRCRGCTALMAVNNFSEGRVLLDVQMPRMDGLAVLEASRKQGIRLPVIVMTVHGNVATAVRAMRSGAFEFEKPFDDAPLLATIHNALTHPGPFRQESEVAQGNRTNRRAQPTGTRGAGWPPGRPTQQDDSLRPDISVRTVEVYRARLGVQTFAEAIRLGVLASLR